MTNTELISLIETHVRNSVIDSFTNLRLQSILLSIARGSIVATFQTGEEFQQAVEDNPATALLAYVENDTVYTGDTEVVLWRIPGRGVGQLAIDFITDERV